MDGRRGYRHPLPDPGAAAVHHLPVDVCHHYTRRDQRLYAGHCRLHNLLWRPLPRKSMVLGRAGQVLGHRVPGSELVDLCGHGYPLYAFSK